MSVDSDGNLLTKLKDAAIKVTKVVAKGIQVEDKVEINKRKFKVVRILTRGRIHLKEVR